MSPATCEQCRNEVGYDDVVALKCDLGYTHEICNDCMKAIHQRAKRAKEKK